MAERRIKRLTPENFTVTLENDKNVWIDGCIAVLVYDDERIVLKLRKRNLTVTGSSLTLEAFSDRELCISGRITGIALEERG